MFHSRNYYTGLAAAKTTPTVAGAPSANPPIDAEKQGRGTKDVVRKEPMVGNQGRTTKVLAEKELTVENQAVTGKKNFEIFEQCVKPKAATNLDEKKVVSNAPRPIVGAGNNLSGKVAGKETATANSSNKTVPNVARSKSSAAAPVTPVFKIPTTFVYQNQTLKKTKINGITAFVPLEVDPSAGSSTSEQQDVVPMDIQLLEPTAKTSVGKEPFQFVEFTGQRYHSQQPTILSDEDCMEFLDITFSRLFLENCTNSSLSMRIKMVNTYAMVHVCKDGVKSGEGRTDAMKMIRLVNKYLSSMGGKPKQINCNFCGTVFHDGWEAIAHLETHITFFTCVRESDGETCNNVSGSSRQFIMHLLTEHLRIELATGWRLFMNDVVSKHEIKIAEAAAADPMKKKRN